MLKTFQLRSTTPFVNFINVLCTAFTFADPKSVKKSQLSHKYLFTLLGSASIKAVCRTLMKLSPWNNYIYILRTAFTQFRIIIGNKKTKNIN